MTRIEVFADTILRPGGLGDTYFPALEIRVKEFRSPYVPTLAFPTVVYRALSEQVDPLLVYDAIVRAINGTCADRRPDVRGRN